MNRSNRAMYPSKRTGHIIIYSIRHSIKLLELAIKFMVLIIP